jgi:beta-ketodecanoyl-[acyl-carrier-protein] synthase
MDEIHIAGTGIWYPDDVITNDEIVFSYNAYVDDYNQKNKDLISSGNSASLEHSSSGFIEKASGIKTRHVIDKKNILNINRMMPSVEHEDESKLSIHAIAGIAAAKKAMDDAGVKPSDIDAVILGTSHAARNYPSVAIEIQNELGIDGYAYDMLVGCSSTTFAINNAYSDIASGLAETILVINPEISTPFVNFKRRDIHFIFGDGCVASVISKKNNSDNCFKIIDRKLITKFSNNIRSDWSYLVRAAGDDKSFDDLLFYQNGNSVFKEVCPMVAKFISSQLDINNIKPNEISKFWLHQANSRMVNLIVSKIIGQDEIPTDLAPLPIEKFGNLASAGSLFAFNLNNNIQKGEKGIICSFGAGYSVCSILVEKV